MHTKSVSRPRGCRRRNAKTRKREDPTTQNTKTRKRENAKTVVLFSGFLVFSLSRLLFLGCIFSVRRSICSAVSSPALAIDIRVQRLLENRRSSTLLQGFDTSSECFNPARKHQVMIYTVQFWLGVWVVCYWALMVAFDMDLMMYLRISNLRCSLVFRNVE